MSFVEVRFIENKSRIFQNTVRLITIIIIFLRTIFLPTKYDQTQYGNTVYKSFFVKKKKKTSRKSFFFFFQPDILFFYPTYVFRMVRFTKGRPTVVGVSTREYRTSLPGVRMPRWFLGRGFRRKFTFNFGTHSDRFTVMAAVFLRTNTCAV